MSLRDLGVQACNNSILRYEAQAGPQKFPWTSVLTPSLFILFMLYVSTPVVSETVILCRMV
jgi:hypothetical protein